MEYLLLAKNKFQKVAAFPHQEIFQIFRQHLGRVQDQLFQKIKFCLNICYAEMKLV